MKGNGRGKRKWAAPSSAAEPSVGGGDVAADVAGTSAGAAPALASAPAADGAGAGAGATASRPGGVAVDPGAIPAGADEKNDREGPAGRPSKIPRRSEAGGAADDALAAAVVPVDRILPSAVAAAHGGQPAPRSGGAERGTDRVCSSGDAEQEDESSEGRSPGRNASPVVAAAAAQEQRRGKMPRRSARAAAALGVGGGGGGGSGCGGGGGGGGGSGCGGGGGGGGSGGGTMPHPTRQNGGDTGASAGPSRGGAGEWQWASTGQEGGPVAAAAAAAAPAAGVVGVRPSDRPWRERVAGNGNCNREVGFGFGARASAGAGAGTRAGAGPSRGDVHGGDAPRVGRDVALSQAFVQAAIERGAARERARAAATRLQAATAATFPRDLHREGSGSGSGSLSGGGSNGGVNSGEGDRERGYTEEGKEAEEGRELDLVAAPRAEGLTGDDFQCNICWELLARPVTLVCGHTACESCMAKYLRAQAQAQAQIGNLRANRISCPAGCQRMIPLVLPEVTTMVQKLLTRGFPRAYRTRLQETEPERALVSQVRRIADDAAAESRRRRRRHHHLGGGGGGGRGGGAVGGVPGGLPREVVGFGNVPAGFMQGFHGQQNAARFRLDVAVPQRDVPPVVARWYKRMGLGLFVCLCVSWQHPTSGESFWHPSLAFWQRRTDKPTSMETMTPSDVGIYAAGERHHHRVEGGSPGSRESGGGDGDGDMSGGFGSCSVSDESEAEEGAEVSPSPRMGKGEGSWLFSMELNAQEFIANNRWNAIRSFPPANNPWSSPLFLYLNDPVLLSSSSSEELPSIASSSASPTAGAGAHSVGVGTSDSSSGRRSSAPSSSAVGGSSASHPLEWWSTLTSPVMYTLRKVEAASSCVARFVFASSASSAPPPHFSLSDGGDSSSSNGSGAAAGIGEAGGGDHAGGADGGGARAEESRPHQHRKGPASGQEEGGRGREGREGKSESSSAGSSSAGSLPADSLSGDGATHPAATAPGGVGLEGRRRLFLEFFGPIVGVFAALGFPPWLAELSTVAAAQLIPVLAVMPLLRLSSWSVGGRRGSESADDLVSLDFSMDLVVYAMFTLLITTATFWRVTWRAFKREQPRSRSVKLLLKSAAVHLAREVLIIKMVFPMIEHVLFSYVLQWRSRYLLVWLTISLRILVMRLLACLRVVLLVSGPFLPRGLTHTLETLWCHLFTYLLLGTRFFNAFFVGDGPRRHDAQRVARRWVRAIRDVRAGAQAAAEAAAAPPPFHHHHQQQQQQHAGAGAAGGLGEGANRNPAAAAAAALGPNDNDDNHPAGLPPLAGLAQGHVQAARLGGAAVAGQQQHQQRPGGGGGGAIGEGGGGEAADGGNQGVAAAAAAGVPLVRPVVRRGVVVQAGAGGALVAAPPPGRREAHLLALAAAGNEDRRYRVAL